MVSTLPNSPLERKQVYQNAKQSVFQQSKSVSEIMSGKNKILYHVAVPDSVSLQHLTTNYISLTQTGLVKANLVFGK